MEKIEINLVELINGLAKGPALEQRGQGGIQDAGVAGCAAEDASARYSGLSPAWIQVALEKGVTVRAIMLKVKLCFSVRNNFFSPSHM